MRHDTQHRDDARLIDLGAATAVTQGDFLRTKTEQVVIPDHWDAP